MPTCVSRIINMTYTLTAEDEAGNARRFGDVFKGARNYYVYIWTYWTANTPWLEWVEEIDFYGQASPGAPYQLIKRVTLSDLRRGWPVTYYDGVVNLGDISGLYRLLIVVSHWTENRAALPWPPCGQILWFIYGCGEPSNIVANVGFYMELIPDNWLR